MIASLYGIIGILIVAVAFASLCSFIDILFQNRNDNEFQLAGIWLILSLIALTKILEIIMTL